MSLTEKFGLPLPHYQQLLNVFAAFPEVSKVILYGSRARGDHKPSSDIDLTLVGIHLNSLILAKIENAIDDLLLPYKVDMSLFKDIDHLTLINNIESQGIVFYESTSHPK